MSNSIRLATPADAEELLRIYAPYVNETTVSFETEVPTVAEFSGRIEKTLQQYPYIVYEAENHIAGYAYASRHRERAAYRYDVDVSIYTLPKFHGLGVAGKLYQCLFALLKELGYCNAYAGCTVPNPKSLRFHEKFGFEQIGTHRKTGYKFGQWHDVIWLEKTINEHTAPPPALQSIQDVAPETLDKIFKGM